MLPRVPDSPDELVSRLSFDRYRSGFDPDMD
jgi:hypothetical protein